MVLIYREQDETRKKELEGKFKSETFPNYLKNMEKLLISRGGKHFVGNEVNLPLFVEISPTFFNL
jgi:hypothetical protein